MGHKRRFRRAELLKMLAGQGFEIAKVYGFNKSGAPPWWFYSKILRSGRISKLTLKIFDKTVWIWRRIDGWLPWPGLSLIVIARKPA